jgi:hypothetical protein
LSPLRERRPRGAAVRTVTASESRTKTARSARARRVTRAIPARSRLPGCRPRAASVTSGPIIPSSKSTRNRSTASCFTRRSAC